MVTHVFDNSNLSQEIFAIYKRGGGGGGGAVICSLEHRRKHMLKPGFHQIVTRSWDRTIQVCFDLLLKD